MLESLFNKVADLQDCVLQIKRLLLLDATISSKTVLARRRREAIVKLEIIKQVIIINSMLLKHFHQNLPTYVL